MTDTCRRAILRALTLAPALVAAPSAVAATSPVDAMADADEASLLEVGTRNADAGFAHLCAEALNLHHRAAPAHQAHEDAVAAAQAAMPECPAALRYTCQYRNSQGEVERKWEEQWSPDSDRGGFSLLWNLAHREARRRGVPYSRAIEGELRTQSEEWRAAQAAVRERYRVEETMRASDEADTVFCNALRLVRDYPVRNAEALIVKLHLRAVAEMTDLEADDFAALIADVRRCA